MPNRAQANEAAMVNRDQSRIDFCPIPSHHRGSLTVVTSHVLVPVPSLQAVTSRVLVPVPSLQAVTSRVLVSKPSLHTVQAVSLS